MRFALLLLAPLAACSTPQAAPPRIETVTVKIPVPAPCIHAADIPAEPDPTVIPADARQAADTLAAKVTDLRIWGHSLVAMMGPCVRASP